MIVAQITDTHIKGSGDIAYGKVDTLNFLKRNILHINKLMPRVDAVIVTGDMTDKGTSGEFAALRTELDCLLMPYFVVPGNHDHRVNLLTAFADKAYLSDCEEFVQYAVDDFSFRLIAMDTLVSMQPYGELTKEKLEWLDECLAGKPDMPTLIFQHHHPFQSGIQFMDDQNLRNGAEEIALLSRHPQVKHIACGHVHRASETVMNGIGVSIAPNGAHSITLDMSGSDNISFMMEPPAIRLFLLDADRGTVVSHLSCVGDYDGPHPFFDESGALVD